MGLDSSAVCGTRTTIAAVIPAIVLAAGRSTRMGRLKATLPIDDRDTFLTRIVRTFNEAMVANVTVVLGYEAAAISLEIGRSDLSPSPQLVVNTGFDDGQLSSLLVGLNAIDRPGVEAMFLTLVDAPLFSAATVRAIADRYDATRAPIVRPVSGGEHGHPVLIDRTLFDALRGADPTHGAKLIVRGNVSAQGDVEVDDDGAFMDIDTPDEYQKAMNWLRQRHQGHPEP
jgi:molybdenum cofactor cytidylyltransferase